MIGKFKIVYDQLVKLDPEIAGIYRNAAPVQTVPTRGNPSGEQYAQLSFDQTVKIWEKAYADDKKITSAEAEALYVILQDTYFERGAKESLIAAILHDSGQEAILDGIKRTKLTGKKLDPVYTALGSGSTSNVTFRSPGTHIDYSPAQYEAVAQLIRKKKITVFELDARKLDLYIGFGGASYESPENQFFIYKTVTPKQKGPLVVHEATHAIQDWLDNKSQVKYREADAYIAQYLAMPDVKQRVKQANSTIDGEKQGLKAAALVLQGKAKTETKEWKSAYKDVVTWVATKSQYQRNAESRVDTSKNKKGKLTEKQQFERALKSLETKKRR